MHVDDIDVCACELLKWCGHVLKSHLVNLLVYRQENEKESVENFISHVSTLLPTSSIKHP